MNSGYPIMKMHGCGNDFVFYVDYEEKTTAAQVRGICAFHTGIGADGVITITKSRTPKAKYRMKYFNADGSMAEMCGNGIRCFAKYLLDNKLVTKKGPIPVDTDAGIIVPEILTNSKRKAKVRVNMGKPITYDPKQITMVPNKNGPVKVNLKFDNVKLEGTFISMGNPHIVFFVKKNAQSYAMEYGPKIEKMTKYFPQKVNVEFVEVNNRGTLTVHVWERGSGLTLACGTGACATLAAAVLNNISNSFAKIHLPGGTLEVSWEGGSGSVYLTGPAKNSFRIYDLMAYLL